MLFRRRELAFLLTGLGCACSSGKGPPADEGKDAGGLIISIPDASVCRDSGAVLVPVDGGAIDPLCTTSTPAVSFTADVLPILKLCTGEICHAPWKYDTLVGQHSTTCCDHRWLVLPGQPSVSHVVQALRATNACVPQMPLDEGSLAASDIATIVAWVCQGALDN